jgi:ribosomal protein S18 acetylase RimI-like enzyme
VVALSLGGVVDASTLPGWLAESDGEVVGLLTYRTSGDVVDIVTINAFTGGGVGAALVEALVAEVRGRAARLRVTTTNDNTRALRFYQRAGFRLTALRQGAMAEARRVKPQIPERGNDGIPIRDQIDLEMDLSR